MKKVKGLYYEEYEHKLRAYTTQPTSTTHVAWAWW